jgi:hypothetical protein
MEAREDAVADVVYDIPAKERMQGDRSKTTLEKHHIKPKTSKHAPLY